MRKNVSLESQICDIIANSTVESSFKGVEFKQSSTKTTKYEFCADFEEELKRRARSLSRKKVERFPVPKVQKVLAVFSKHRGMIDKIVKAVDKCTYGKTLLRMDVFKTSRYDLIPITDLGVSWKDAETLFLNYRDIPYALTIMPKAYMN